MYLTFFHDLNHTYIQLLHTEIRNVNVNFTIYICVPSKLMLTDPVAHVPVQEAQQLLGTAG